MFIISNHFLQKLLTIFLNIRKALMVGHFECFLPKEMRWIFSKIFFTFGLYTYLTFSNSRNQCYGKMERWMRQMTGRWTDGRAEKPELTRPFRKAVVQYLGSNFDIQHIAQIDHNPYFPAIFLEKVLIS